MPSLLSRLTRADAVQAAMDEFVRAGRDAFLERHGFGRSRSYRVRDPRTGTLCDSKAIVGVAFGIEHPHEGALTPADFSGGEATVRVVLERLGFEVVQRDAEPAPADAATRGWSRLEVEATVADYLSMLASHLAGVPYSKAAHRRALLSRLNGRSEQAIEFKHSNISAVLRDGGFVYLPGYQPRSNYQALLAEVVTERVQGDARLNALAAADSDRPMVVPEVDDILAVLTEPPRIEPPAAAGADGAWGQRLLRVDYVEREARNRSLGEAGEAFVLNFERARLIHEGREALAGRIEHTSRVRGDGAGYDILSFDADGRERLIEVKTTKHGAQTPFFVSRNEVEVSARCAEQFRIYRLYAFQQAPRLYQLPGAIGQTCWLEAASYRARPVGAMR